MDALVVHERTVGGQRVHDDVMTVLVDDPDVRRRDARILDEDVVVAAAADSLTPRARRETPTFKPRTDPFEHRLMHAGPAIRAQSRLTGVLMQFLSGKQLGSLRSHRVSAIGARRRLTTAIHREAQASNQSATITNTPGRARAASLARPERCRVCMNRQLAGVLAVQGQRQQPAGCSMGENHRQLKIPNPSRPTRVPCAVAGSARCRHR